MEESKLALSNNINDKIRSLKPLILNLKVERYDSYILENEELGLFTIQKNLYRAKKEILKQINDLLEEYAYCSEDNLTYGGLRFRNKLLEYFSKK